VLGDVDVLPFPQGQAPHQRPRPGAPEVSPERAIVALAKHLSTQPAADRNTEAVRLALPATIQKAATHQIRPAFRRVAADWYACQLSRGSTAKVWTNVGERKRSLEGTGGDGALVCPVPGDSSEPASATNILVHGG
jgi:hypothetical protein